MTDLGGNLYDKANKAYQVIFKELNDKSAWVHQKQCLDSLGSIPTSIAEGTGRKLKSVKYYQHSLLIARGAAYETLAWLDCRREFGQETTNLLFGRTVLEHLILDITEELMEIS